MNSVRIMTSKWALRRTTQCSLIINEQSHNAYNILRYLFYVVLQPFVAAEMNYSLAMGDKWITANWGAVKWRERVVSRRLIRRSEELIRCRSLRSSEKFVGRRFVRSSEELIRCRSSRSSEKLVRFNDSFHKLRIAAQVS